MRLRLTAYVARASRRLVLRVSAAAVSVALLSCSAPDSPADLAHKRKVSAPAISHPRAPAVHTEAGAQGSTATGAEHKTRKLNPQDALLIVEQSGLQFIAPRPKNKEKVYGAHEFADMLRRKWDWLGADIEDLDHFIDQIASDAFTTFEPYRVRHPDGREQEFSAWLRTRLKERRATLSGGGGTVGEHSAE
jgi:hypothetical protein